MSDDPGDPDWPDGDQPQRDGPGSGDAGTAEETGRASDGGRASDDPPASNGGRASDEPGDRATAGAGGARVGGDAGDAERAVTGETPLEAAVERTGALDRLSAWYGHLTTEERYVLAATLGFVGLLALSVVVGFIRAPYLLYLLALAGMYVMMTMGLNVQWGYTGLINFSVAAFFGVGAYAAALTTASSSPVAGGLPPVAGVVLAVVAAVGLALLVGLPTLSLREDYLAIATLGLAEVVRTVLLNERQWTNGSAGLYGIPSLFTSWPVLGGIRGQFETALVNLWLVGATVLAVWLLLRRIHRSPWGRVQRLIRSDEALASALGKHTFVFRLQSFVIGSVIMALGGVFYAHLNLFVNPSALSPIRTFYVWIAVILGGAGSDRGAIFGGVVVIAILEGTRFLGGLSAFVDPGALRLFLVGALIIAVMHLRPEGVLPPQRELIWPGAEGGESDE